jgi:hypothetical protein
MTAGYMPTVMTIWFGIPDGEWVQDTLELGRCGLRAATIPSYQTR